MAVLVIFLIQAAVVCLAAGVFALLLCFWAAWMAGDGRGLSLTGDDRGVRRRLGVMLRLV